MCACMCVWMLRPTAGDRVKPNHGGAQLRSVLFGDLREVRQRNQPQVSSFILDFAATIDASPKPLGWCVVSQMHPFRSTADKCDRDSAMVSLDVKMDL